MKEKNYSRQIFYVLVLFAIVVFGTVGKVLASVVLPVVVSLMISFVLYPIIKKLNRKAHLPWALGTVIMVISVVFLFGILATFVGNSVTSFLSQYSRYENKLLSLYKLFAEIFGFQFDAEKNFLENVWGQLKVREFLQNLALSLSGNVISFGKALSLILLFTFFLLLELKFGGEKIDAMFNGKVQGRVKGIVKKTISDTARFLSIKFIISLATGLLVFLVCFILRMDFAPMWGFLAFVLNFIPTFGSIFSVLTMTLFALLQFYPSPVKMILVLVLTTMINFVLGNIVEPKIEGKNLGISPFVILVSLTFWGWMWDFVGMIIAVPIMVMIKICCENVSFLQPIAILLGNRPSETEKEFYRDEDETENAENETPSGCGNAETCEGEKSSAAESAENSF